MTFLQKVTVKSCLMVTIQLRIIINAYLRRCTKIMQTISCIYRVSISKFIKLRRCNPDLSSPVQVKLHYFSFLYHVSPHNHSINFLLLTRFSPLASDNKPLNFPALEKIFLGTHFMRPQVFFFHPLKLRLFLSFTLRILYCA